MGYLCLATGRRIVSVSRKLRQEKQEIAMLSYQGLFLVVLIFSSARLLLADILVQNGYRQYHGYPYYVQQKPMPRYQAIPSEQYQVPPSEQYVGQQLANERWMQYPYYVMYPSYGMYQDESRLNLVGYPLFRYHHYHRPTYHYSLPRPTHHLHYTKIGGHGYTRPSVFVGNPSVVHYRYRRSDKSDPTSIDSSKPAVTTHDVATESPISETKNPTIIDSVLPENEPTDTNNKRVENRQSKNEHVTKPLLLGLYPEKMYRGHRQIRGQNNYVLRKASIPEHRDEQFLETVAGVEPIAISRQDQETSYINDGTPHLTRDKPTKNLEQSSISAPSQGSSEKELTSHAAYYKYYENYGNRYRNTIANSWPMTSVKLYPTMPYESRYWPKYYPKKYPEEEAQMYPATWKKYIPVYQQGANQEFDKEYSQKITNIDATNKAMSGEDRITVYIPCPGCEPVPEPTREPTTDNAPPGEGVVTATTSVPCVTCTQYRNNEELPRTNEIIDIDNNSPYYDRINTQVSYDNTNYNLDYWNEYPDEDSDNEPMDPYSDFNRHINSVYSTPVSSIPDYVLNTNLGARSNPVTYVPITPQTQGKYFSTYTFPTERTYNPQVYNYYPTVPSYRSVPLYTFSSPAYY